MRTSTILKALFILTIGFTFTCSDDDGGSPSSDFSTIPEGTVSMSLDGTTWASSTVSGVSNFAVSTITISGGVDFLFVVLEDTAVSEYAITGDSGTSITYRTINGSEDFTTDDQSAATGRINIQERDEENKTISGSFMGTLIDDDGASKVITKGLFNKISYGN